MNTKHRLMMSMVLVAVLVFCAVSCGGQLSGGKAERTGVPASSMMTRYEYGEGINAAIGIPSGAKAYRTAGEKPIGEPVLVASDSALVDEEVKGEKLRLIKVNFSLRNTSGKEVAKSVVWFRPFGDESYVVKTLLDGRYQSIYTWGKIPGHSEATIETTDIQSGAKVHETVKLSFVANSQGLFRGIERDYADGKLVCETAFIRHLGTGLLVDEVVGEGTLPRDYHPYEFVLIGWPSGRSPGFGGPGIGGLF